MVSRKRKAAVRLGIPGLIVAALTLVALWRVGSSTPPGGIESPAQVTAPGPPITDPAALPEAERGRRVELDSVPVREVRSARAFWIDAGGTDRVFVVLDPDVKRSHEARLTPGARVSLIGLVRRSPEPDVAVRQWNVDAATAQMVRANGTYLYVTEVRPGI